MRNLINKNRQAQAQQFPNRQILLCLLLSLLLTVAGWAKGNGDPAPVPAATKPLVLLFAASTEELGGKTIITVADKRAKEAQFAVRDLIGGSGVADAVAFDADAPMIARAMQETHLTLSSSLLPEPAERLALGKAVGAAFVVVVLPLPATSGYDLEMQAIEVSNGKPWEFHTHTGSITTALTPLPPRLPRQRYSDTVLSAANTLVLRFLGGPMRPYTGAPLSGIIGNTEVLTTTPADATALTASVAPTTPAMPVPTTGPTTPTPTTVIPKPTPTTTRPIPPTSPTGATVIIAAPPTAPATYEVNPNSDGDTAWAQAEREQGEALLSQGDVRGAITLLRRAVSGAPRLAQSRIALIRAYLVAKQPDDAVSEARRALAILPPSERKGRAQVLALLTQSVTKDNNPATARAAYQKILTDEPDATWARVALAEMYLTEGKTVLAEREYQTARQTDPQSHDVQEGLARILAQRGDYTGALDLLAADKSALSRYEGARLLFDDQMGHIAEVFQQNRRAWEDGKLSREVLYKATHGQAGQAAGLTRLLRVAAPPADSPLAKAHAQRVQAGTALALAITALETFLESGDAATGVKATNLLGEYQKGMAQAAILDVAK